MVGQLEHKKCTPIFRSTLFDFCGEEQKWADCLFEDLGCLGLGLLPNPFEKDKCQA